MLQTRITYIQSKHCTSLIQCYGSQRTNHNKRLFNYVLGFIVMTIDINLITLVHVVCNLWITTDIPNGINYKD